MKCKYVIEGSYQYHTARDTMDAWMFVEKGAMDALRRHTKSIHTVNPGTYHDNGVEYRIVKTGTELKIYKGYDIIFEGTINSPY
jgi:hypothetical protein